MDFKITSKFAPTGDQPQAIKQLTEGIQQGERTNKKVVILNMYADGVSMENIIKWADADENLVKAVIAEYKESRA